MTLIPQLPAETGIDSDATDADEATDLIAQFDEIERGLTATPDDFDLLLRAARWSERAGRYDAASQFYFRAVTLAPSRTEPLVALADMMRGQSLHAEATELLKTAIDRLPAETELWCAIARVMADIGLLDKADFFLTEALRLEPNNLTARLQRGALRRRIETGSGPVAS